MPKRSGFDEGFNDPGDHDITDGLRRSLEGPRGPVEEPDQPTGLFADAALRAHLFQPDIPERFEPVGSPELRALIGPPTNPEIEPQDPYDPVTDPFAKALSGFGVWQIP